MNFLRNLCVATKLEHINGEIVAYSLADKQDTSFVLDTFQVYQEAVNGKGITMSMSRKGNKTKQPVAGSFPATGCLNLKGVLIPVSQTAISFSFPRKLFCYK